MLYQVSRNGQMYGPYSLADLQRYVASGNVLLTDLAKSDDMPDWLLVSQILATHGAAAPAYPPTAAPMPQYGYPDPPNIPWVLALFLGIFTCGLFFAVWDIVEAAWFHKIQPASRVLPYYIAALVLHLAQYGHFASRWNMVLHHHPPAHNYGGNVLALVTFIIVIVARFTFRNALEQHYNTAEPIGLRLNGVMTFFFGGLYFQYHFNRINEIKRAIQYRGIAP